MQLIKGQKMDITKGRKLSSLALNFGWTAQVTGIGIDAAAFLLSERNRCERDEDFIFYGNPQSSNGAVTHTPLNSHGREKISISLNRLPQEIARISLTMTIYEGDKQGHTMKQVKDAYLQIVDEGSGEELGRFDYGSDLSDETAVVAAELYQYNGEWKLHAVGSGFNGGLAALCTHYGLEVEESEDTESAAAAEAISGAAPAPEPPAQAPVPALTSAPTHTPAPAPTAPFSSGIDLRKKLVQITLEKKNLTGVRARVGIVLDISGSMQRLYNNGTVQEVVERVLAVAAKFDDNGSLDVWVYDNEFSRLPSVTERDFGRYVFTHILNNREIHKFGANNEPPVMEDVIRKYTKEEQDETPVFLIFINDGGVLPKTKKIIHAASGEPIFWQFVGIGKSDFKVLKQLDTLEGRLVDNASFIQLNDIERISDEELYERLLTEFPLWLRAAKAKRIIL